MKSKFGEVERKKFERPTDQGEAENHNQGNKKSNNKGFNRFNLRPEIILSILKLGYKMPTPIQRKVIPEMLAGFNVIAKSRTGSGKSAAFIIPTVERLVTHSEIVGVRAVILSPTRELAKQTLDFFYKLTKGMNLKFAVMTGGDKIEGQYEKLATNPDVIIATPGRLVHHLEEGSINLKKVELLVIDEADKLIEQGFEDHIGQIIKSSNPNKQIGLFSATIPDRLVNFMKLGMKDYKLITLEDENKIPDTLKLYMVACRTDERNIALVAIINECIDRQSESTMVFCPTKYHCDYLHEYLKSYGILTSLIYGNMDQSLRDETLKKFRNKQVNILLVTDLAARGLDIPYLENVINFDFPDKPKLFIHRIGRTARAGRQGKVISIVCPTDIAYLMDTKIFIGRRIEYKVPEGANINDTLSNCDVISYGTIPKSVYDHARSTLLEFVHTKIDFEDIEKSTKNAMIKREAFKEKPSGAGIKSAKELETIEIGVNPLFIWSEIHNASDNVGEVNKLALMLKTFKPKKTIFEQINSETNLNQNIVGEFRKNKQKHSHKKEIEKMKEDMKENSISIMQSRAKKLLADEKKDEEDVEEYEYDDEDEDEDENAELNKSSKISPEPNAEGSLLNKKRKRDLQREEIRKKQFISNKSDPKLSAALWGKEGPLNLSDLTLNLCPDDDSGIKKKSQYVWDDKKKRYVSGVGDKKGNLVRKNEAGVKIKEGEKRFSSYKKWMSQTKIRVQRTGEREDTNLVDTAGNKFRERKRMKGQKPVKSELKSYDQLVKDRKDKGRKQTTRFAGQTRRHKEKQISERMHLNRNSMALVRKKGSFNKKGGSKGGKGGKGGRRNK